MVWSIIFTWLCDIHVLKEQRLRGYHYCDLSISENIQSVADD
jgi:hypothetical protein